MCLRWERRNRGNVFEGDSEEHYQVFNLRAVIKNRETVHWLFDVEEWEDMFDGDITDGRSVWEADQYHNEKWS